MKKTNLEIKVGLFVFLALFILGVMIIYFKDFDFYNKGFDVKVHFNFTNGVKIGAPVRFSGVDIGKVKDIHILNEGTSVELVLWIRDNVVLREDVGVFINSLGIMGEKYIEFVGGSAGSAIIKDNWGPIKGVDPLAINEMFNIGQNIAAELNKLISSLRIIVDDKQTVNDLKETFANAKELTKNFNVLSQDLDRVINENLTKNLELMETLLSKVRDKEGTIGKLFYDDALYLEIELLVKEIRANPWKLLSKPRQKVQKSSSRK